MEKSRFCQEKERELKERAQQIYSSLRFQDDFLFCKIMTERPDLAKELLELILGVKIREVVPHRQKPIEITADGRGIRLDVYLDDQAGTVYDLEMQTTRQSFLPKRSRYYQGMIDLDLIGRGAKFSELKRTYIIFICMEDPFSSGRHIYSFENTCRQEPGLLLGDEAYKIFLNASGIRDDVSENLKDFFRFLLTGKGETDLSRKLGEEVEKARTHREWRLEFMTLFMRDEEKREEGRAEGREAERRKAVRSLVLNGVDMTFILKLGYTAEEYEAAISNPLENGE